MKLALVLICAIVALPSIAQAFFFGVTITDVAGATLAVASPTQAGTIIALSVLGSALVFAVGRFSGGFKKKGQIISFGGGGGYGGGGASYGAPSYSAPHYEAPTYSAPHYETPSYSAPSYSAPAPSYSAPAPSYSAPAPSYSAPSTGYAAPSTGYAAPSTGYAAPSTGYAALSEYGAPSYFFRKRGKRDAKQEEKTAELDIDEVFDTLYGNIHKGKFEGCFQRLVCDMAARPEEFPENIPILEGVQLMETHTLKSAEAAGVLKLLSEAVQYGRNATQVTECEAAFNNCDWSGQIIDKVITKYDNQITLQE